MNDLVNKLRKAHLVKRGNFKLSSGGQANAYVDLRAIIGYPGLMEHVARACVEKLMHIPRDLIVAVPYGALPIATLTAYFLRMPLAYVRKENKEWGTGSRIEGVWITGCRAVIVDDVVTTGKSIIRTADVLRDLDIEVTHAVAVVDREQGGWENLNRHHINLNSVLSLRDLS